MRYALPLLLLTGSLGCVNDTGFTRQNDDVDVVSGSGEMIMEPDEMNLWGLTPEITASETLNIQNVGDNLLVIYEARIISSGNGTFYLPEEWQTIERTISPGQSLDMIVAATLAAEGTQQGSLRIKSNDLILLERIVNLRATTDTEETGSTGDSGGAGSDTGATADSGG
jgi:hypothetical protein